EPQELELERERERLECRPAACAEPGDVDEVEEPRQRREGAGVRLRLAEELEHRLRADERDAEARPLLPRLAVRGEELRPGDRLQLARPLVQQELDVRE